MHLRWIPRCIPLVTVGSSKAGPVVIAGGGAWGKRGPTPSMTQRVAHELHSGKGGENEAGAGQQQHRR